MDLHEELYHPIDTISIGTMTLVIFPMFVAIGQLCFNGGYYLQKNQYLKVYVDSFSEFIDQYFLICPLLAQEVESLQETTFAYVNSWKVVKESKKTVCEFNNGKDFKTRFSIFQLTNLFVKFQLVLFKPLCIPTMYSLNLSKFAIFLSKNPIYTTTKVNKFSYETIETLISPLYFSQNVDREYMVELIFRYKKLLVVFLNIQTICLLDEDDDDHIQDEPTTVPQDPKVQVTNLKQMTLLELLPAKKLKIN
jgi:hypothetical protein